ncbi:hypothetical protein [Thermotomaculum hydrothermale]|nr:hypothetical protein [Thermotomaculum hydrothermale]
MSSNNAKLYLYIKQSGINISGGLTGTTGADFKLTGKVEGEAAVGKCYGNNIAVFFNMYFEDSSLYVQLIEPKADGTPDWSKVRELVFVKSGGGGVVSQRQGQSSANPLSKGNSTNFGGNFAGDGLKVSLSQSGSIIKGTLMFNGSNFKIKGKVSGNKAAGVFSTGNGNFNFTAGFKGNTLLFETGGTVYRLKRIGGSSNPLARRKANHLAKKPSENSKYPQKTTSRKGKRITVDSLGLSFVPPKGWIAKQDPKTGNYYMGSNSIPGYILMLPHNYATFDQLVAAAAEGFVDQSTNMHASSDIEKVGEYAVGGEFSGTFQNVPARAYVVGVVSPNGSGGFMAMCVTTTQKYSNTHKKSAIELANSVRFFQAKVNSGLMNWLAGEYYSYVGSTERKLMLCPNGRYSYYSESSYGGGFSDQYGNSTGSWGAADNGGSSGSWKAVGNKSRGTLIFTTNKGEVDERGFQVVGKGVILIDGTKFAYKGRANCN